MQVKNRTREQKETGVVYEVLCKDCPEMYVGETKRTVKVRLSEHRQAVRRGDPKNATAVYVQKNKILHSNDDPNGSGRGGLWKPSRSGNPSRT